MRVLAFGTFDILHKGHRHFLVEAKKHGEHLTVVVARDETVRELKGRLPVNKEEDRVKNLEASGLADRAQLGYKGDKYRVVRDMNPDTICLGYDQEAFTSGLEKSFPKVKIIRLDAFQPEVYKSSKMVSRLA
ncbi:FAD synthase [bacterium]|nr:FAD synthase [bacterium]